MVLQVLRVRILFSFSMVHILTYNIVVIMLRHQNVHGTHIRSPVPLQPVVATSLANIGLSGSRRVRRQALRLQRLAMIYEKRLKTSTIGMKTTLQVRVMVHQSVVHITLTPFLMLL